MTCRGFQDALVRCGVRNCVWLLLEGEDHFTVIERLSDPDYWLTRSIFEMIGLKS